jgi:hypothetical protein
LDFIPRLLAAVPPASALLRIYEDRYRRSHGCDLNYRNLWWTPPLGPKEALALERGQIEALGLQPLVSITDHDNIEAPLLLRVLNESRDAPLSVEWTVPWRDTYFHLGIHNLPGRQAGARMSALARFTEEPREAELCGLLDWLGEDRETLVVFNHPYWNEKGTGQALQNALAEEFLSIYRTWIHALELNGLRSWRENRRVMDLAARAGLPAVSGGDRHGCEPNALINLTRSRSFSEFVAEIRFAGRSAVLVMPQYRESMSSRVLGAIVDVVRDHDGHMHGWTKWSDRVFYRCSADGEAVPLSRIFEPGREPSLIRLFVAAARLMELRGVKAAIRHVLQPAQELSL